MDNQKSISIIIPVYNEEENISTVYTQVTAIVQSSAYTYEFIFVNDGSSDASWPILVQLAQSDPCVHAINFSRNFGHQAALTAGYIHAKGDAVITMDADLQDPPSVLLSMIKKWEDGAQIVYARRIDRKDNFLKRVTAYMYYFLLDSVSEVSMPRNVADFRLLDRKVVRLINAMPERARCLRGMVAWAGFSHAFVDFKRPDRIAGVTGYTWKKMFKLGFDGLTSFSMMPLRVALYMGTMLLVLSMGAAFYGIGLSLMGLPYAFTTWVAIGLSVCVGMQFMCLWMLGEYVGRIYDQQKERPLFIIAQKLGAEKNNEAILNAAQSQQRELQ